MSGVTRRQFLRRSGGLLLLAAGCGEGGGAPRAGAERSGASPEACAERDVAHRYGRAEVAGVPERLVSLTARDQDTAIALGTIPVAVRDGFYERSYASRPWVREALGDRDPEILPEGGELNFDRLALLRPDLIAAAGSGITRRDYEILSGIAPTVAQSGRFADYGAPWQVITRVLGRALCREARAEARIAQLEDRLDAVRAERPALAGATVAVALPGGPDGSYWVYGPQDSRMRFLIELGMEPTPRIAELVRDRFARTISAERLDLLEADVLVWLASPEQRATLSRNPVYRRLAVAREGRDLFLRLDGLLTAALTSTSILNLPFLIRELVPRLGALLEGRRREEGGD